MHTLLFETTTTVSAFCKYTFNPPQQNVHVERQVRPGKKPNSVTVGVTIFKGDASGFARYTDSLPPGVKVIAEMTEGASFSVADGKVRFVWTAMPDKDRMFIAFTLVGAKPILTLAKGEFSYIENSKTRRIKVQPLAVEWEGRFTYKAPASSGPKSPAVTTRTGTRTATKPASSHPVSAGLIYKVQIGAYREASITAEQLKKKYRLQANVESETQSGYTKFLTGSFRSLQEATKYKERLIRENKIETAFVVAYHNGRRISASQARTLEKQTR